MAGEKKETLLVLSDLHRGAAISNLPDYEKTLFKKIHEKKYDHVVLNGDIFELFYINPDFYKKFREDGKGEPPAPKYVVKHAIRKSIDFLKKFLEENPDCHLHFVLGNHENMRKFRHQLDDLQKEYKNFEWDPDSIRVGNALFMHGDIAIDKHSRGPDQKDEDIPRLRYTVNANTWQKVLSSVHEPGYWIDKITAHPRKAAEKVNNWIMGHDGQFSYLEKGKRHLFHLHEPLHENNNERGQRELPWLKHVFFGHTHIKFIDVPIQGIHYHNTGALVRSTAGHDMPHGMLEAEMVDGRIENVAQFNMTRADIAR